MTTAIDDDLDREGRLLVERLGGRWAAGRGLCRCPAHDDRSPSLSVRTGHKRLLFHCFAGCSASEILRALARGGLERAASASGRGGAGPASSDGRAARAGQRLWRETRPLAGSPADFYLRARKLICTDPSLRFHPRTPDGPRPLTRFRPALVAAVRDASGLAAVHRTFLCRAESGGWRADGRAALGRPGTGAVRLGGIAMRIGLAEGIETALSAIRLFGLPCWATLGAERFAAIALPDAVEEVVLFLDNDAASRRLVADARAAYAPRRVLTRIPGAQGADWNDTLRAREERGRG